MSRSRRKVASASCNDTWAKRVANKKVRKTEDVIDGGFYRKVYDSWNIRDYNPVAFSGTDLERRLSFNRKHKLYMK